jgi:hypothetical protein
MKLTKSVISGLIIPEGKKELIVHDSELPGFGIRLRAGGSRVWFLQYKIGVKSRRMTFGDAASLDPIKARKIAMDLKAKVRLGMDPQAEKFATRAAAGKQSPGLKAENVRLRKLLTDAMLENTALKELLTKK